jgi:hypothetical protein
MFESFRQEEKLLGKKVFSVAGSGRLTIYTGWLMALVLYGSVHVR